MRALLRVQCWFMERGMRMLVLPRGSSYLAIAVFAAAFDPLSTMELADFSSAIGDFGALDWLVLQGTPVSPSRSGCLRWASAE